MHKLTVFMMLVLTPIGGSAGQRTVDFILRGVGLLPLGVLDDHVNLSPGVGAGCALNLTHTTAVELAFNYYFASYEPEVNVGEWTYSMYDVFLDVRYSLEPERVAFAPYIAAGMGAATSSLRFETPIIMVEESNTDLSLHGGVGFRYAVGERLAVDAKTMYTFVDTEAEAVTYVTFSLGVSREFGGGN